MFSVAPRAAIIAACSLTLSLAAAPALAGTVTLQSMQFSAGKPVPHLHYEGEVIEGDLERIAAAVSQYVDCDPKTLPDTGGNCAVITMTSEGGNYVEGLRIAHFLRENAIATWVKTGSYCYSACAFAFLGGSGHSSWHATGDYIDRTTGVQTIYQMIGLADMVRERGGEPLEPAEYKQRYLDGLWERIKDRVAGLREGRIPRRDLMVPGAEEVLAGLAARGVRCYLASGTDVEFVRDECAALGLAGYFWQIHGAIADYRSYSKAQVIRQILSEYDVQGHQLVTFGDGFVEIEETVGAGGIAVGVASDEAGRSGAVDAWKRRRLIEAGAHVIVPDFQDANALLAYLFAED